jgi:hypothetical protein
MGYDQIARFNLYGFVFPEKTFERNDHSSYHFPRPRLPFKTQIVSRSIYFE